MNLSLAQASDVLIPVAAFVIGIGVYAVFIFEFYRFLARRDVFQFDLSRYTQGKHIRRKKILRSIVYVVEYLLVFPIIACVWIAVFTFLLAFLAKEQSTETILLVSIAVVGAIRITAYYNEDLSKDLAKILPFATLAIFLIDISYFSISASLDSLKQAIYQFDDLVYYLIFIIVLEFALRIAYLIKTLVLRHRKSPAV